MNFFDREDSKIRKQKKKIRVEEAKLTILDALNDNRVFREIKEREVDSIETTINFLDEYGDREEL